MLRSSYSEHGPQKVLVSSRLDFGLGSSNGSSIWQLWVLLVWQVFLEFFHRIISISKCEKIIRKTWSPLKVPL